MKKKTEEKSNYLGSETLIIILIGLYVGWIFLYDYLAEITGILEICNSSTWSKYGRWLPSNVDDGTWSSRRRIIEFIKYVVGIPVIVIGVVMAAYVVSFIKKVISKNNERQV